MYTQAKDVLEQLGWYGYPYWRIWRDNKRDVPLHQFPVSPDDTVDYPRSEAHLKNVLAKLPPGLYYMRVGKDAKYNTQLEWQFQHGAAEISGPAAGAAPAPLPPMDVDLYRRMGELEAEARYKSEIAGFDLKMRELEHKMELERTRREADDKLKKEKEGQGLEQLLMQLAPALVGMLGSKAAPAAAPAMAGHTMAGPASEPPATADEDEARISRAIDEMAHKASGYTPVADALERLADLTPDMLTGLMQNLDKWLPKKTS
jgi:hypothetical protein